MNSSKNVVNNTESSAIDLYLFGPPRVVVADQLIQFRSRKILALFIYLAVTKKSHSRDHLMVLLWPNSDRKRANTSLRNSLSRLEAAFPFTEKVLDLNGKLVQLNPAQTIRLDLSQIAQATLPSASNSTLDSVLNTDLDEFLAGFSLADALPFDDWVNVQREYWQQQINLIFERETESRLQGGQAGLAIKRITKWITIAPVNEIAYQQLMKAHTLAGNRVAALQAFEACQQMLHRELGVEPLP